MFAPMWPQYASRTKTSLLVSERKTTKFSPRQSTLFTAPALTSIEVAKAYHPFGKGGRRFFPIFRNFLARFAGDF